MRKTGIHGGRWHVTRTPKTWDKREDNDKVAVYCMLMVSNVQPFFVTLLTDFKKDYKYFFNTWTHVILHAGFDFGIILVEMVQKIIIWKWYFLHFLRIGLWNRCVLRTGLKIVAGETKSFAVLIVLFNKLCCYSWIRLGVRFRNPMDWKCGWYFLKMQNMTQRKIPNKT